jgi:Carboxypeptidase regulatory-like domain
MFRTIIWFAISIALANSLVFAQGFTGAISGTVKDESGAVLEGATVTAKHVETGLSRAAVTDASGSYSIPSLPVGAYEITAHRGNSSSR